MISSYAIWVALGAALFGGVSSAIRLSLRNPARAALELLCVRAGKTRRLEGLRKLMDQPDAMLALLAMATHLLGALAACAVVLWVAALREQTAIGWTDIGIAAPIAAVALWIALAAAPLSVATHASERVLYITSPLLRAVALIAILTRPAQAFIDEVIRRLAGAEPVSDADAIEAELMSVVEEGEREGAIDESARDMIEAVVEFRTKSVGSIMTPRTEVESLEATDDLDAIVRYARAVGHSRIPVYEQDLDHILGVLYVKDLLPWTSGRSESFTLRETLRDAIFVPETKTVRELLEELIERKVHIAMVADEYGGTAGLVTIEDIVEEIFGEIRDEYEPETERDPLIEVQVETRSAVIEARAYIDDVNDALEPLGLELPDEADYDTLGGFVVTKLGKIPDTGDSFTYDGATVTIVEAAANRVLKVRLELAEEDNDRKSPPNGNEPDANEPINAA